MLCSNITSMLPQLATVIMVITVKTKSPPNQRRIFKMRDRIQQECSLPRNKRDLLQKSLNVLNFLRGSMQRLALGMLKVITNLRCKLILSLRFYTHNKIYIAGNAALRGCPHPHFLSQQTFFFFLNFTYRKLNYDGFAHPTFWEPIKIEVKLTKIIM